MVYEILIPAVPFLGAYITTFVLYKKGLIRKALHVNLWNFILLLSFIVSGGAGFLLMVLMELGIISTANLGLLYWHVEFGITLTLVTIFHLHTYWKSTRKILFGSKKNKGV